MTPTADTRARNRRAALNAYVTEQAWQNQVLALASTLGWRTMHVRRTIGVYGQWTTGTSVTGWPDLVLWNETQRRILYVELKTETGRPTDAQLAVLRSLARAGAEVHLWRPRHFPRARQVLAGVAA